MNKKYLEKTCGECGKDILIMSGDYAYKKRKKGKTVWYCSYKCFRKNA